MEEYNKETEKRKNIKPIIILVAIIVIVGLLAFFAIKYSENIKSFIANLKEQKNSTNLAFQTIKNDTSIEHEKLVLKSTSEYNTIVEYVFEDNKAKTVKVYQEFEQKEEFNKKKENYEKQNAYKILYVNEETNSIEIERENLGTEQGLTYEELCEKYLVKILGAYDKL